MDHDEIAALELDVPHVVEEDALTGCGLREDVAGVLLLVDGQVSPALVGVGGCAVRNPQVVVRGGRAQGGRAASRQLAKHAVELRIAAKAGLERGG